MWKKFYSSYFSEYCICRKFIYCALDKFIAVLNLVSQIYKPELPATAGATAETHLLPQAQPIAEALPQAPEPTVKGPVTQASAS